MQSVNRSAAASIIVDIKGVFLNASHRLQPRTKHVGMMFPSKPRLTTANVYRDTVLVSFFAKKKRVKCSRTDGATTRIV